MKTVKDAVKEFNGVWPSNTKNTNYWFAGSLSNMHYEIDGVLKHVCSKKEFEDYAKMQKLNSINKEGQSDKPIIDNNVKIYPESKGFISNAIDKAVEIINKDAAKSANNNHECGQAEKVKPVYTQEMADNNDLPTAGMICNIRIEGANYADQCDFEGAYISFVGDKVVVFTLDDEEYCFCFNLVNFEVADTRTDEEKLIDELKSCLLLSDEKACGDKVDFEHFEQHSNDLLEKFDIKLK